MDRTPELQYLISGDNRYGRVNLSRATAASAGDQIVVTNPGTLETITVLEAQSWFKRSAS
jgi:hypothetical protein